MHDFRATDEGGGSAAADPVDQQYSGKKEHLRPIHDAVIGLARKLGDDVEIAPKKAYVSLRRSKQFAQVEPATNSQVEVGLNQKGHEAAGRLQSASGMVTHKVRLSPSPRWTPSSKAGCARRTSGREIRGDAYA